MPTFPSSQRNESTVLRFIDASYYWSKTLLSRDYVEVLPKITMNSLTPCSASKGENHASQRCRAILWLVLSFLSSSYWSLRNLLKYVYFTGLSLPLDKAASYLNKRKNRWQYQQRLNKWRIYKCCYKLKESFTMNNSTGVVTCTDSCQRGIGWNRQKSLHGVPR